MPSFAWRYAPLGASPGRSTCDLSRGDSTDGAEILFGAGPDAGGGVPPVPRGSSPGLRRGRSAATLLDHTEGRRPVLFQLLGRTDRTDDQLSAAVRAAPAQPRLRAVPAEGAFKAADHGIGGLGRQVLVAAFAIRSELQHL